MTKRKSPPSLQLPILAQGLFVQQWWRDYVTPHERFRVTTRDGVGLQGVHLKTGHDTLLVYCHGFLSSKNFITVPRFLELLAEDVDVIAFDFRGHGESEGSSTLGESELLDVEAVLDYARGVGYRRIFLSGSSMGGAVAIRYAANSPEVAGVATVGAFANSEFSFAARWALGFFDWQVTHSVVRAARRARVESIAHLSAPVDVVQRLTPRPLLLIHGEFDLLVPVRHAYELYARARDPKDLIVIPRGSHDIPNLNRRTVGWIIEWIRRNEACGSPAGPRGAIGNRLEGQCSTGKS